MPYLFRVQNLTVLLKLSVTCEQCQKNFFFGRKHTQSKSDFEFFQSISVETYFLCDVIILEIIKVEKRQSDSSAGNRCEHQQERQVLSLRERTRTARRMKIFFKGTGEWERE